MDASQRTSGDTEDDENRVEIRRCARRSVNDGDVETGSASRIKVVGTEWRDVRFLDSNGW